ncbi:MAG: ROK family transcriptional regulator, partial [Brachybacterium tyrofermentans]
ASVAAMLDPEAILLGGETRDLVRSADPVLEDTLRACLAPMQRDIAVRDLPGEFEDWARGAAIVAIQQFVGPAR